MTNTIALAIIILIITIVLVRELYILEQRVLSSHKYYTNCIKNLQSQVNTLQLQRTTSIHPTIRKDSPNVK